MVRAIHPNLARPTTLDEDEDAGFIGRQKERKEVEDIYKKLMDESPWSGVIGVQGDSGIGKSRFLQYVARVAKKAKSTVLTGFALDTESSTSVFCMEVDCNSDYSGYCFL